MPRFFSMPRGDLLYLVGVLVFALVAFLPWSSGEGALGLAWLGWMMAALMILSPILALIRILAERRARS